MNKKIWTIKELILWSYDYFKDKNIDSPRLTAELLLAKTLQKDRIYLYTNFDKPLTKEELSQYKTLIKRRVAGEPTAYIIGEKEFWSLNFKVDKSTLIPRPETEVLIECILDSINEPSKEIAILELGTGCGNIAISLAKELKNAIIISVDISFNALKIALFNKKKHNLKNVFFLNSNMLDGIKFNNYFDILVSNPPYIKSSEIEQLQREIKNYEPLSALDGGANGLKFYKTILSNGKDILKTGGELFLEFGDTTQGEEIKKIALENNYNSIEIINDYSNSPRVFHCKV